MNRIVKHDKKSYYKGIYDEKSHKFIIYEEPPAGNFFEIYFTGTTIYNLRAGNSILLADNPLWDMGNNQTRTTINANFNYTYTSPYLEPVNKTIRFSLDDINVSGFNTLYMYGNNLTTQINKIHGVDLSSIKSLNDLRIYYTKIKELDLSSITSLGGRVQLQQNPDLVSITMPSVMDNNAPYFTRLDVLYNFSLKSLDISMLTKLGGIFQAYSTTTTRMSLTGVTFPSVLDNNVNNMTDFNFFKTSLTGNQDLSMFTKLCVAFQFYDHPYLTGVTLPSVINSGTPDFSQFYLHSCDFRTLDLSAFWNLRRATTTTTQFRFDASNNPNLTTILFPEVLTGASLMCLTNFIYLNNCALNQTTVDALFAELLRYYSAITPAGNVSILLNGGTNALPSSQGNADISSLQTIFSNAGRTLSITLNT